MRRRPVLWVSIALLAAFFYEGILRSVVYGWVVLPLFPGGLPGLTAILACCSLTHAWYSLGGRMTLFFFVTSAAIAWSFEQAGVLTGAVYGPYHYTEYLGPKLGEVPLAIPMAWFMMIYPSYVIANLILSGRSTGTAAGIRNLLALTAASAVFMTAWDLVIDPILSGPSVRAWIWEAGGPYFGVPLQNYAGWLLTTFTVYLVFRFVEQRRAQRNGRPAGTRPPRGRAAGRHLRPDARLGAGERCWSSRAGRHRAACDGASNRGGGVAIADDARWRCVHVIGIATSVAPSRSARYR